MAKAGASTRKRGDSQGETPVEAQEDFQGLEGASLFPGIDQKEDDFIRVLRRDDYDKKMVFHGRLAPHEATTDKVAELFGGGEYKTIYFTTTDQGSKIAGTRTFKLPGPYKPPTGALPGIGQATAGGAQQAASSSSPKVEVGTVNASEALNSALVGSVIDLLKGMRETQAAPVARVEWGPIVASITTVLTTIITTFGNRKPDDSSKQMFEMMEKMTDMLKPAINPQGQSSSVVKEMIEGIQSILDLKEQLDGKSAASAADPEMRMMEMGAKMIEVMSGAAASGAAQPGKQLLPGRPPAVDPAMPLWQRLLLGQKASLLRSASMGVEPDFAADIAITYMPQEVIGVVKEFVAMPDASSKLMNAIPEMQNFPQWAEKFLAALRANVTEEDETKEDQGDAQP